MGAYHEFPFSPLIREVYVATRQVFTDNIRRDIRDLEKAKSEILRYKAEGINSEDDAGLFDFYFKEVCRQDMFVIEQIESLYIVEELFIIKIYKELETSRTRILGLMFPEKNVRDFHNFNKLTSIFPFIRTLKQSVFIEEMRLVYNAIKHVGVVSRELSSHFQARVAGERIKGLDVMITSAFDNHVGEYWSDFLDKVSSISGKEVPYIESHNVEGPWLDISKWDPFKPNKYVDWLE